MCTCQRSKRLQGLPGAAKSKFSAITPDIMPRPETVAHVALLVSDTGSMNLTLNSNIRKEQRQTCRDYAKQVNAQFRCETVWQTKCKLAAILVIFRSRHLSCPLQDLEQDVGSCVAPPDKMSEVVKVLRPYKLQQLDLQSMSLVLLQHACCTVCKRCDVILSTASRCMCGPAGNGA